MTEPDVETNDPIDLSRIFDEHKKKKNTKTVGLTLACRVDFMSLIEQIAKQNSMTRSEVAFLLLNDRLQELGLTDENGNPRIEVPEYVQGKRSKAA